VENIHGLLKECSLVVLPKPK